MLRLSRLEGGPEFATRKMAVCKGEGFGDLAGNRDKDPNHLDMWSMGQCRGGELRRT
jgi:hypothetical protein